MINFAVHEVEDGRRFWGQVAEEESLSALLRIHTVLREAAKYVVLGSFVLFVCLLVFINTFVV